MQFIHVEGTTKLERALIDVIDLNLNENKKVLWLATGGSNIAVDIKVMAGLTSSNLNNLLVILTDERFGAPGHQDSNFHQLQTGGFDIRDATFNNLLQGKSLIDTVTLSSEAMKNAFTNADVVIGFFGMGPDGHIAGILPNSPAAITDEVWMIGYETEQFTRLTLTPYALSHINTAYVGAFGVQKVEALENLRDKMLPITVQPAQILRHIPEVFIYNDQTD